MDLITKDTHELQRIIKEKKESIRKEKNKSKEKHKECDQEPERARAREREKERQEREKEAEKERERAEKEKRQGKTGAHIDYLNHSHIGFVCFGCRVHN